MFKILGIFASLLVFSAAALIAQPAYPLDQEMKSSFGGTCSVEMICKVTKAGDVYVYMYSIKNTSSKSVKVKWDIVNQAMYFGNNLDLMIDLEPDENVVFTLQHPEEPAETRGRVTAFYLTTNTKVENLIGRTPELPKGMKIEISKKTLYNSESGTGFGALPKSFVYPRPRFK